MFGLKKKNDQDQTPVSVPDVQQDAAPKKSTWRERRAEKKAAKKAQSKAAKPSKPTRKERKAEKAKEKAKRKVTPPPLPAPTQVPGPRRPQHDAQGDEKKKASRKTIWVALLTLAGFGAVTGALEILAVRGQLEFGTHYLGLEGPLRHVTWVALEGGTLVSASLALWAMLKGDKYFWHRVWTTIFLGAAMLANYLGVLAAGGELVGAVYTAGFSIAVLRFWHAILKRIRRDLEQPDSWIRYSLTRWVLAFKETFKAWKLSHTEKMSADAALYWVRHQAVTAAPESSDDEQAVDVTTMTKKNAVLYAAKVLGSFQPSEVRPWLAEHGVTVDHSYTAQLLRDESEARQRELTRALESN